MIPWTLMALKSMYLQLTKKWKQMRLTGKHLLFYHSILYHVTVYRQSHLNSSFLKNYATLVTFYCSGAIADFNTKLHTTVRNSAILYFNVSGILTLVLSGSGNLILFSFFFSFFPDLFQTSFILIVQAWWKFFQTFSFVFEQIYWVFKIWHVSPQNPFCIILLLFPRDSHIWTWFPFSKGCPNSFLQLAISPCHCVSCSFRISVLHH